MSKKSSDNSGQSFLSGELHIIDGTWPDGKKQTKAFFAKHRALEVAEAMAANGAATIEYRLRNRAGDVVGRHLFSGDDVRKVAKELPEAAPTTV